jgi:5-methyltetrahydrofolate corrinoid/iron sulfur protein methyltransferase
MLIVGELINTSRSAVSENVDKKDDKFIRDLASKQAEAGADYIDINCGTRGATEAETMKWLIENVRKVVETPLSIDSSNPAVMDIGLAAVKEEDIILNSISSETDRYKGMLPLALKYKTKLIALAMDDRGIPKTGDEKFKVGKQLIDNLVKEGIAIENIYLDLLVQPLSVSDKSGVELMKAVQLFKKEMPEVKLISALSNISFGLPNRKLLNRIFLVQTMTAGMDAYILDPTDKEVMGFLYATEALLGRDRYCGKYLSAYRKGFYNK